MYENQIRAGQALGAINQQAYSGEDACQRQPEVYAAFDRLGRLLEALGGVSNTVSDRLVSVMRSEPPNATKPPGTITASSSPMARKIEDMCDQLEGNMSILTNVLGRLEI